VRFQSFTLANPYRVVIDLPEVGWKLSRDRSMRGGIIADFRFGMFRAGVSRVVLDVKGPVEISKSFVIPPRNGRPHRLVIDLRSIDRDAFARNLRPRTMAGPAPGGLPPPAIRPRGRKIQRADAKKVVAIDPGHGGIDPGTIGVSGKLEKHIVMALAKVLRRRLQKSGRYKVVLTRNRDIFVPLRERIAIARAAGAELFISLHADSISNRRIRGGTIYTLSERASDKEAAALAKRENKADVIAGIDLNTHSVEVANILIDLAQREAKNDAVKFADALTGELRGSMKLLRNNRRFAGFAVLKAPDVPSVLVELGYLSNRADERLLGNPRHQANVAAAIVRAINTYFLRQQAFKQP